MDDYFSEVLGEAPPEESRLQSAAIGINWLFDNFNYQVHTFQFIGKKNGKTHSPVRVFRNTDREKALSIAMKYNNDGYDVYFMVNEGDGITHAGKKVPRAQESVKELSKLYIDTDNCAIALVREYLESIGLTPHYQIESSPGKYHLHFFFEPVEKTPQYILKWKAIQHIMHRLGDVSIENPSKVLGTDSTMSDFAKILRVPGFYHIDKKFLVHIESGVDQPAFSFEDVFDQTSANDYLNFNKETHGTNNPSNVPSLTDTYTIEPGGRFAALQSLALHLANSSAPFSDKFGTYTLFARQRLDNTDQTYVDENQALTPKAIELFHSAVSKVDLEQRKEQESYISSSADEAPRNPWHLDDEFYLSAPNGFGDVVKQVMGYSLYPCAALSFGVFLTGLSILKAKTHLTPKGSSPALYTLNVAMSGFGKGDPFTLLQNLFNKNGMRNIIGNKIRSDRGIYNQLKTGDGVALFLLDEVAPLLKAIQRDDAATHHAYISEALLQLYSQGSTLGVTFGKTESTGKKGETEIVIDNPVIAVCGFTVPSEFEKMFRADSVTKGLFQRFIPIFPELTYVDENPNADKQGVIDSPLFQPYIDSEEFSDDGSPVPPLHTNARVRMSYSPEALDYAREIQKGYRIKMIELAKNEETQAKSALYSRLGEQIERVATTLSLSEIDLPTLKYAQRFIESRHEAILALFRDGMLSDNPNAARSIKQEERVLEGIARHCSETTRTLVPKSEVFKRVRRHFQGSREFDQTLSDLDAQGKIEVIKNHRESNEKAGKPGTFLKLKSVF